ncbi:MAG TPA: GTP-binding protein, partial [Blastocatellia bacterium]|nr:GTP-binding protein [Blastocatellia bacterium]
MKVYDTKEIRNVGIVGHGDVGKTSLVSAMLFGAGATQRLGRVDEGNTVTDYDDEEIARRITINSALAHCEWNGAKINILDTPGYAAFILDAKASLRVCE